MIRKRFLQLLFFILPVTLKADSTDIKLFVRSIFLQGNKVTRASVIRRELSLKEGDTIAASLLTNILEEDRRKLENTLLFNEVRLIPVFTDQKDVIDIRIEMVERWYIWPSAIFEFADRNFNQWLLTKDLTRTNIGLMIQHKNFLGLNQYLKLKAQWGYTQKFEFTYTIPNFNKRKTLNLVFNNLYLRNHEVGYTTVDHKVQFIHSSEKFIYYRNTSTIQLVYRPRFYSYLKADVGLQFQHAEDTVLYSPSDFQFFMDLRAMQPSRIQRAFLFKLSYVYDHRDLVSYPLEGEYFGIGISNEFFIYPAVTNIPSCRLDAGIYRKINPKHYYAFFLTADASSLSTQPYFSMRALGYNNDFVRGYEYYVYDAQQFVLLKGTYKLKLFEIKKEFKKIRLTQFNTVPLAGYLNIFSDVATAKLRNLKGAETSFLLGYGLGIDLVTYYDKMISIDFSRNLKGENGVFLHFTYHL